VALPPELLTQHIAIVGKTGAGKTYTGKGLVERLLADKRRVCILDPTGVWWGLRSSADGKRAGFPVIVFGGAHADVPIAEQSGATLAKIIAAKNVPAIIEYPAGGTVALTDAGRGIANAPRETPTLADLHESWLRIVPAPQAAILDALIQIHPAAIAKHELADRVGVSRTSGGFFNNLGRLRTLGAIDYPSPGAARASDILFPGVTA
jgi:hypothetical protein